MSHLTDKPQSDALGWAESSALRISTAEPHERVHFTDRCCSGVSFPRECHVETFVAASSGLKPATGPCGAGLPEFLLLFSFCHQTCFCCCFLQRYHLPGSAREVTLALGSFWPEPLEYFAHYASAQKFGDYGKGIARNSAGFIEFHEGPELVLLLYAV